MKLTLRQRATWIAHAYKAVFHQYHRQLVPLLSKLIGTDAIVLDVGAHAGQFTKIFGALMRGGTGRVYAFEPSRYTCSILNLVKFVWRLENVTVQNWGLGAAPGRLVLSTPLKKSGSVAFGQASLVPRSFTGPMRTEDIDVTTLDGFAHCHNLRRVDFIKMDVEGYELDIILGGHTLLKAHRPYLLLEVNGHALRAAGHSPDTLRVALQGLGYGFFHLANYDGKRTDPLRLAPGFAEGDVLCVHESRGDHVEQAAVELGLALATPAT